VSFPASCAILFRRLLAQLRPDPGEQLNRLKWNTQYVVRTEVESMAALQRPAIREQDDLDWRGCLIAFELNQETTTVECSYIRLQQDQLRRMLKNSPDVCALRYRGIVPGAGKLRHQPCTAAWRDL
jgi:hypothetical protein